MSVHQDEDSEEDKLSIIDKEWTNLFIQNPHLLNSSKPFLTSSAEPISDSKYLASKSS